jgi:predicted DNA-binding transcriptional regulator YafY
MAQVVYTDEQTAVRFTYRNYRGEVGERHVIPRGIFFGATEYHPEPQWLLSAFDVDKGAPRTFAVRDIKNWRPAWSPPRTRP